MGWGNVSTQSHWVESPKESSPASCIFVLSAQRLAGFNQKSKRLKAGTWPNDLCQAVYVLAPNHSSGIQWNRCVFLWSLQFADSIKPLDLPALLYKPRRNLLSLPSQQSRTFSNSDFHMKVSTTGVTSSKRKARCESFWHQSP